MFFFFFFQAEDGIRDKLVTGVQTCALPILLDEADPAASAADITVQVASIDTREAQRDAHLRSADFFDAETYPTLTFRSTAVRGVRAGGFTLLGDRKSVV